MTRHWSHVPLAALAAAFLVLALLPSALALPMSLGSDELLRFPPSGFTVRWFREFVSDSEWTAALWFSVWVGVVTATGATIIGGLAAWPLSRTRFFGRAPLWAIALSPLVVPPVALASGCFLVWAKVGLLGGPLPIIATQMVFGIPYVLVVCGNAMARIDDDMLRAAASLGAGPVRTARLVVLPVIRDSLVAGWAFALVMSLDEVVITPFLLLPGDTPTLAVKMLTSLRTELTPVIAAAAIISASVTTTLAVGAALRARADTVAPAA